MRTLMGRFTKDLVPGRAPLGWLSLVVFIAALAASFVTFQLGVAHWPEAFIGLMWVNIAAFTYARGRTGVATVSSGGLGIAMIMTALLMGH